MAERPLLLFPRPESVEREKMQPCRGRFHSPTRSRQGTRTVPIFQRLQDSFNARQVELQDTPTGADPEQVLVIETVGAVEDFVRAVEKIPGLEWMGEFDVDEIEPDEDFFDEDNRDKKLTGRLYMVMSNQQALAQMLSLWNRYKDNPDDMNFRRGGEYFGLAKFKDVFNHLKDIRRWGLQDRLAENEMFDDWRHTLQQTPNQPVRFEAELWFRHNEDKRSESEQNISSLISRLGGEIKGQCAIPEIAYHAILAELPAHAAQQIINHPEVDLTRCDNVMFFRPVGQVSTEREPLEEENAEYPAEEKAPPTGDPVVAVLDGMPLENHSLLADRLQIDDPDNWASEYQATERQHGTAVASLVVNGDLSNDEIPLSRPVYIRPIMKPNSKDFDSPRSEHIPDDVLLVDFIHQAVRRIVATDNPVAPTIKIINLSIGDPSRQFDRLISPFARLLDWLSTEYNILFIISAGNHCDSIDTGLSEDEFSQLSDDDIEKIIVECLYGNSRHRRLLSPAESLNNITVGAVHHDNSAAVGTGHFIDVFSCPLPSPISAFGSGHRRSIKPEVLYSGGRVLFEKPIGSSNTNIRMSTRRIAPGNWVAATGTQAGQINNRRYCCGTSNSAALITRSASFCYDTLLEIFRDQAPEINLDAFIVPLLKAMIVHGCSWEQAGDKLKDILGEYVDGNQLRQQVSRWLGYGVPDISRVLDCTPQRATILGFGELSNDQAHVFSLPLPPSLGAVRQMRKLTATLAWLSPVVPTTQKYREAQLWFDVGSELETSRKESEWRSVRRGTVQHEIFEGERAVAINDGDELNVKVNCKQDARKISNPIRYGLMVSLEVAEGVDLQIYDEIKAKIALAVEIRPQDREQ